MPKLRRLSRAGLCLLATGAIAGAAPTSALARRHARPRPTAASAQSGSVLFDGSTTAGWYNQSASANRVALVPDPAGTADQVLQFTAYNSDIAPLTPNSNPRAQLITPANLLTPGVAFWESYQLYLPTSFPTAQTWGGWVAFGSPFYGAPWTGTPSVSLQIMNGQFLWEANGNAAFPWAPLWRSPVVTGRWIRFTWYVVPATSGFAELYVNDRPVWVRTAGPLQRGADLAVIDQSNAQGPWYSQLSVYYQHNEFPQLTAYFKDFKIATTQQAAES
jgi:hypothetical protein